MTDITHESDTEYSKLNNQFTTLGKEVMLLVALACLSISEYSHTFHFKLFFTSK